MAAQSAPWGRVVLSVRYDSSWRHKKVRDHAKPALVGGSVVSGVAVGAAFGGPMGFTVACGWGWVQFFGELGLEHWAKNAPVAKHVADILGEEAYNPSLQAKGADCLCNGHECPMVAVKDLDRKPAKRYGRDPCWRGSFAWHLNRCHTLGGFMMQIVEKDGKLGDGQVLEEEMARKLGIRVFRYAPQDELDNSFDIDAMAEKAVIL